MMASLFAGVSGLKNHQLKMNVVGDNIANINTIGFKMGRVTFQEALVQTLRGASRPTSTQGGCNPLQLGLGMSLNTIDNIFLQGGLETTGQITDLAIQGAGFFVLSDGQQDFYTRAGAFSFDATSNMVNPGNGFVLQGKMADVDGTIPANVSIGNITLPFGQQDPARATEEIVLGMNLESNATDSEALLISAGSSNVNTVSGFARDGSGGTHSITITGNNAEFSQMAGTHANVLTDVLAVDITPTINVGGGSLPADDYVYRVIAVNALGQSTCEDIVVNGVALNDSVTLDWTGNIDADATEVWIYRKRATADWTDADCGLLAQVAVGANTYIDDYSDQASPSNPSSINTTVNLTGDELLSALGVTDISDFQISVDNGAWATLSQLTLNSTINDLMAAINSNAPGVTASIQNGEVHLKRDYAGAASIYNIRVRDQGATDVCEMIFDASGSLNIANGAASTLVATDIFTPNVTGVPLDPVILSLLTDSDTGIITGISDLGGGGVTVSSGQAGLAASTLVIETEDTQHATSITTYDSQGGKHTITITFTKSWNDNEWFWSAEVSAGESIRSGGSGTVNFNQDGSLASFGFDGGATSLRIDPNNGSENMDIDLIAGSPAAFDGLTGFASSSTAAARSQDGYGLGVLSNISISPSGTITGMFTNGVSRILAQIYIAEFNNPAGLLKSGRNMYQTSPNSGAAIMGIADTTSSSTITSGALEISNVDLAQEFTGMIVAQRGFQANARVITTSDEMLNELVALKR